MKIQKRVEEFVTQIVRRIFALYRPKVTEFDPVDDASKGSRGTSPIDEYPLTDPLSWEVVAELIQDHGSLSNQYVSLTAQQLGLNWPDSLKFLQLKELRDNSADQLNERLFPHIDDDEQATVITTLGKVLFYWSKPTHETEVADLSPEKFVNETLEKYIDATAKEIVIRRAENESRQEIGHSLGLTSKQIRQIENHTLSQINQLPEIDYFKILLHSRRISIEHQLLGKHGCTKINDLPKVLTDNQLVCLSVKCLFGSLLKYADAHFVRFRNLFLRDGTEIRKLDMEFDIIENEIENLSLPMRIELAAQELDVSADALRWFITSTTEFGLLNNHLYKGRLSRRKQRGIQLIQITSGCYGGKPTSFYQLLSTYRFLFPHDPCSFRDIRNTIFEFPQQILSLCDAGYCAISKFTALNDRSLIKKADVPFLSADEYRSFEPEGLQTEMADLVDEIGPAPVLAIRDEFVRRFGQKWSANSVYPTLKSTAYFRRMAPGIIGTLPMTDDPEKLTIHTCLLTQTQVRIYILARVSKSRITYPLWNPEVEYKWCVWGDQNLPWKLYASLLSVANPDEWPVSEDKKYTWKSRITSDGSFAISIAPLQLSNTVPSIREILALALFASNNSTISWMDINRILGHRIDSRNSLSYVVILSKLGILRLPMNWLLPLEVNTRATYRFINELVCNDRMGNSWRDFPEFLESNGDTNASWINMRELEQLLENMLSGKTENISGNQPDLFENL